MKALSGADLQQAQVIGCMAAQYEYTGEDNSL